MGRPDPTYYKNGQVVFTHQKNGLVKCELFEFFGDTVYATFYVPSPSKDNLGFVPENIVRYRLKRDFNIEIGHYSVMHTL